MKDDIKTRVGLNIIRVREAQGLTQERLGALAGLHRAYVGQVERGEKNMGLRNLQKIAEALQVPVEILVDNCSIDG